MFVYNLKINSKTIFKTIFTLMVIGVAIFCIFIACKIIFKNGEPVQNKVYEIEPENYTNVLKAVHDDIDTYIGQKISFSGYVYRVYDLQENQFVLARDMIVSTDFQTLVVGFLCTCENANNFKDNDWVEITGEITKGYYHNDIPIIKVTEIKETKKPKNPCVYPPDDLYIPTSSFLYVRS